MLLKRKIVYFICIGILVTATAFFCGWLTQRLYISTMGTTASVHRPRIVLDAGHGGIDGGATGNGITEKEINLILVEKTEMLCELFGFDVVLTRSEDISIHDPDKKTVRSQKNSDLRNRLEIMKEPGLCAAVSIHLNKFPQSSVKGAQVFYSPNLPQSKVLAETIQTNIHTYVQPENSRKIKKADSALFLLYNNSVNPAVMVECGFLSNPEEAERLQSGEHQDRLAMSLCYSLMKFNNLEEEYVDGSKQSEE